MFSPPIRLVPPTWCLRLRDPIIPLILERPVGWQHVVLSTTATLELLKNHPILASALLTLKEVSSGSLEEQSQVVGSLASQHKSLRTFLAPEPFLHSAQGALLSAGLAISRHSCSASGGKRGARWNSAISLRGDGGGSHVNRFPAPVLIFSQAPFRTLTIHPYTTLPTPRPQPSVPWSLSSRSCNSFRVCVFCVPSHQLEKNTHSQARPCLQKRLAGTSCHGPGDYEPERKRSLVSKDICSSYINA